MHWALSGATTPDQSGPGSNGNEGVFRIPQSSSITGDSQSDCLVLYPGHSLGRFLPLYRGAVSIFYSPSQLGKDKLVTVKDIHENLEIVLRLK